MTRALARLLALTLLTPLAGRAVAQTAAAPEPDAAEQRLHTDWAWIGRYRAENAALVASGVRPDVVFMGDSITEGWPGKAPATFAPGRTGRGISGQTTPQMLVRFHEDVVALHPRAVHIMAGTNDIAGNTGPMTLEETQANIVSMTELAKAGGVAVILGSVPPAASFPWRPGLETAQTIRTLNAWIRSYAAQVGATYADYTAVLDDGRGGMKPGYASDGVHPTAAGYAAMAPVTEAAIAKVLGR